MFEDFKNKFIKQNKEKKEQMKKLFLSGKYNIENNKNKEKNNDIINTKEEKEKNTITQI